VADLAAQREAARSAREWAAADQLRQAILALGWQVIDTRDGPRLEKLPVGVSTP
jgi:cysteinyl-tRNA synthetase